MYHQRIAYPQSKIVELESRRAAVAGGGAVADSGRLGTGPDLGGSDGPGADAG